MMEISLCKKRRAQRDSAEKTSEFGLDESDRSRMKNAINYFALLY
jgi:hypothetical protein